MSPEQVEGHGEVDHRSDIYSLGMTCYEMLAGRLPFEEESSEYKIMRTIVEEDLPRLGTFAAGVPNELQKIIMKAVAKDPADRFQSAVEMREALEELEELAEQEASDQEQATVAADTIAADTGPPTPDARTRPAEDAGEESASASSVQEASSGSTVRRVAGAGAVLAAVLAGVWHLAVGLGTPTAEPEQEATAAVEQGAPEGTTSEEGATGETQEENLSSTEGSSENPSEEESDGEASSSEPDSDTRPSGDDASDPQAGQTAEKQPTGENTGRQAESGGANAAEEKTADAGATGAEASDQEASDRETADTNENQETSRPDLPSPIDALLGIVDPSVLDERVDELVKKGQLTRGDEPGDFFTPGQCYIFVVGSSRVEAVLGPETDGTRVELRSGENLEDWSSRYSNNRQIWVK